MRVDLNNLSCGYNGKAIVENINLSIGEREIWCILGANGIGKTTFFKTLLKLIKPISGQVLYNGKELKNCSHRELARQISYVPQSHTPPFPFLVKEVISMGRNPYQQGMGRLSAKDRAAIDEAIEILSIGYLAEKKYTEISGGERQLTLLARAIAQNTPIMVLDEPVANLDFGNQARVISHISNLVENMNRTMIMTTHSPDHGLLLDAKVFMMFKEGKHSVGKGSEIITEESVKELYDIENQIIDIPSCGRTVCLPMYGESEKEK
ncbi:MAG: ABC transporter ATP-binding protein [Coriobacteriia bacterium]|nr:ABC transporter ATP-binding protein [Coriobacteriia bacterium]